MHRAPQGSARPVAGSVDDLLGPGVEREPVTGTDGKSGAMLERVVVDGRRCVLKHLSRDADWVMRATGDLAGRPVTVWRTGLLDRLPACIDHVTLGVAWDERRGAGAILMDDVAEWLLPEGDGVIPLEQHLAFVDHMAQLHAVFWDAPDTGELLPLGDRLVLFGPRLAEVERARGGTDVVPTQLVPVGWERFAEWAPRAAQVVRTLHDDPTPLIAALAGYPQTFVHGDWKAGNLGSRADGRTILLDWALPGTAPPCLDLGWYVCLNRARLPQTKAATLAAYREALERHGIDTGPWWDRQLSLCLLGLVLLFGWEKALGEGLDAEDELAWWVDRALEGAQLL